MNYPVPPPPRTPLQQACADHLAQIRSLPDTNRQAVLLGSFEHLMDTMQVALLNSAMDVEEGEDL